MSILGLDLDWVPVPDPGCENDEQNTNTQARQGPSQECFICGDKFLRERDRGLSSDQLHPAASDKLIRFISFHQQTSFGDASTNLPVSGLNKSVDYYHQLFARPDVNFCWKCSIKIEQILSVIEQLDLIGEQISALQDEVVGTLVKSVGRKKCTLNEPRRNVLRELESRLCASRPSRAQVKEEPEPEAQIAQPLPLQPEPTRKRRSGRNRNYHDPSLAYVKLVRLEDFAISKATRVRSERNVFEGSDSISQNLVEAKSTCEEPELSDYEDNYSPPLHDVNDNPESGQENDNGSTKQPLLSLSTLTLSKPHRRGGPANIHGLYYLSCEFKGCDTRAESVVALRQHVTSTHLPGSDHEFLCQYCGTDFSKAEELQTHMARHKMHKNKYRCRFCPLILTRGNGVYRHYAKRHDPKTEHTRRKFKVKGVNVKRVRSTTSKCSPTSAKKPKAKQALQNVVTEKTSTATEPCKKKRKQRGRRKLPKECYADDKAEFQCKFCELMFSYPVLWDHVKHDHEAQLIQRQSSSTDSQAETEETELPSGTNLISASPLNLKCNFCSMRSPRLAGIYYHIRAIHSREVISNYDAVFPLNAKVPPVAVWKNKKRIADDDTQLICDLCGKIFKSTCALNRHARTHTAPTDSTKVKRFPCDRCPKVLSTCLSLRYHVRTCHDKQFLLSCKLCEFRCMANYQLLEHTRIQHTREYTLFCEICGKGFFKQYKLTVHIRSHTGENPFVCKYCGKAFAEKGNCKQHETIVHGTERPHVCEFCGDRFPTTHFRKRHIKSHHEKKGPGAVKTTRKSKYNWNPDQHSQSTTTECSKPVVPVGSAEQPPPFENMALTLNISDTLPQPQQCSSM